MRFVRFLVFATALLTMSFGFRSISSTPTSAQNDIDPACVSVCQLAQRECFIGATRNSEQNKCLAEYRHCIAQCGKH